LAGRQRRAALDCQPPLWGHGIHQKTTKQQSTCGWRRARAAGGLRGVTEVTRYARIINLVAWRRRAAKKLPPPPLLGQQKTKKNSNNNQPVGCDVSGVRSTSGGHESDPWRPPSPVGEAAAPGGLRRPKHPPGSKFQRKRAHTTINRSKGTRGSSRRALGGV